MTQAGQQLRQIRERLGLRYRDVVRASTQIAARHGKPEFQVGLSRLADIENKGTLPSAYRLYSLAAIYKLEFRAVLRWYGIDLDQLAADAMEVPLQSTTLLETETPHSALSPVPTPAFDSRRTVYLSRLMKSWGRIPAFWAAAAHPGRNRYAFVGLNDWFMNPLVRPGSLVQIDPRRRRVVSSGWTSEWDRPMYLIEHRDGFRCAWCSEQEEHLVLQPHPASGQVAEIHRSDAVEVLGQVIAVAFRFDPVQPRRKRF